MAGEIVDVRRRCTRRSAVITHHVHSTPPLILTVLSRLDGGIQSATEMLPLNGARLLHIVLTAPPCLSDMRLVEYFEASFVINKIYLCVARPPYCGYVSC